MPKTDELATPTMKAPTPQLQKFAESFDEKVRNINAMELGEARNKKVAALREFVLGSAPTEDRERFEKFFDEHEDELKNGPSASPAQASDAKSDLANTPGKPKTEILTITQKFIKLLQDAYERYLSGEKTMTQKLGTAVADKAREVWKKANPRADLSDPVWQTRFAAAKKTFIKAASPELSQEAAAQSFSDTFGNATGYTRNEFNRKYRQAINNVMSDDKVGHDQGFKAKMNASQKAASAEMFPKRSAASPTPKPQPGKANTIDEYDAKALDNKVQHQQGPNQPANPQTEPAPELPRLD